MQNQRPPLEKLVDEGLVKVTDHVHTVNGDKNITHTPNTIQGRKMSKNGRFVFFFNVCQGGGKTFQSKKLRGFVDNLTMPT